MRRHIGTLQHLRKATKRPHYALNDLERCLRALLEIVRQAVIRILARHAWTSTVHATYTASHATVHSAHTTTVHASPIHAAAVATSVHTAAIATTTEARVGRGEGGAVARSIRGTIAGAIGSIVGGGACGICGVVGGVAICDIGQGRRTVR